MPAVEKFEQIDKIINSGKYARTKEGNYVVDKCNLFLDDVTRDLFEIDLPRAKDVDYQNWTTTSGGNIGDWPENPMPAAWLDDYYRERSTLVSSGVKEIKSEQVNKAANAGQLVLVLGEGHATIAAPNKKNWPLIFRSDLANRGRDKRTRVGIKKNSTLRFYQINPKTYNEFNGAIAEMGMTDKDIYRPWHADQKGTWKGRNENYYFLHNKLKNAKEK